jgi:hypothetical protein
MIHGIILGTTLGTHGMAVIGDTGHGITIHGYQDHIMEVTITTTTANHIRQMQDMPEVDIVVHSHHVKLFPEDLQEM